MISTGEVEAAKGTSSAAVAEAIGQGISQLHVNFHAGFARNRLRQSAHWATPICRHILCWLGSGLEQEIAKLLKRKRLAVVKSLPIMATRRGQSVFYLLRLNAFSDCAQGHALG